MKLSLVCFLVAKHLNNLACELEQFEDGAECTDKFNRNVDTSGMTEQLEPPNLKEAMIQVEAQEATTQKKEKKAKEKTEKVEQTPVVEIPVIKEAKEISIDDVKRYGGDVCKAFPEGRTKIDQLLKKLGVDHSSKLTPEQRKIFVENCLDLLSKGKQENEF